MSFEANGSSHAYEQTDNANIVEALIGIKNVLSPVGPKEYIALVTQTGVGAPVATVLKNTLGAVPVWGRSAAGTYSLVSAGTFTVGKTTIEAGCENTLTVGLGGNTTCNEVVGTHTSADELDFTTFPDGSPAGDGLLQGMTIKVTVYP